MPWIAAPLLPQPGGFEGLLAGLEEAEAENPQVLQFPDAEEVALTSDPAAPAGSGLREDRHDHVARIDVFRAHCAEGREGVGSLGEPRNVLRVQRQGGEG
jgi:hypothetical protein